MDTPMQLSVRDILAVSSDVAGYLHNQTQKHQIPIATSTPASTATVSHVSSLPATANINNVTHEWKKAYYALPSGRAKSTFTINFLSM